MTFEINQTQSKKKLRFNTGDRNVSIEISRQELETYLLEIHQEKTTS